MSARSEYHSYHDCSHNVEYCESCDEVYCTDCEKIWTVPCTETHIFYDTITFPADTGTSTITTTSDTTDCSHGK